MKDLIEELESLSNAIEAGGMVEVPEGFGDATERLLRALRTIHGDDVAVAGRLEELERQQGLVFRSLWYTLTAARKSIEAHLSGGMTDEQRLSTEESWEILGELREELFAEKGPSPLDFAVVTDWLAEGSGSDVVSHHIEERNKILLAQHGKKLPPELEEQIANYAKSVAAQYGHKVKAEMPRRSATISSVLPPGGKVEEEE